MEFSERHGKVWHGAVRYSKIWHAAVNPCMVKALQALPTGEVWEGPLGPSSIMQTKGCEGR